MQTGASDAKEGLSKLANNVSNWWAKLDPVSKPSPTSPSSQLGSSTEFQVLTGLLSDATCPHSPFMKAT